MFKKFSTLIRYILKELVSPFTFGLALFTFIFLMGKIREFLNLIVNQGVDVFKALELLIYIIPAILAITIPMGFLLSVFITYGRLTEDKEMVAMKASGVSNFVIFTPAMIAGIIVSIFLVIFNDTALPIGNYQYAHEFFKIMASKAQISLKEKTFIDAFDNITLYTDVIEPRTSLMKGVRIKVENKKEPESMMYVFSRTGKLISYDKDFILQLELYDGEIHKIYRDRDETYYITKFDTFTKYIDMNESLDHIQEFVKGPRMSTAGEILQDIKKEKNPDVKRNLMIEYHKRFSIPFASIVFVLLAIPFAIMIKHGSRFAGIGVSVCIIFLYYLLLYLGIELAQKELLSPFMGLWFPNIVLVIVGLPIFMKYQK